jgi:carbon starvation protein
MIQDLVGSVVPSFRKTESWANNLIGSALAVGAWGYFLYQGVIDPMGGINTLWPLFGISNQMLAGIALILCTVVLFKMKRQRYAWVTIAPALWLLICTLTAGWLKIFSAEPTIGFVAHAWKFSDAVAAGKILAPAKTLAEMQQVIVNDYVDATLCALFVMVVLAMVFYGVIAIRRALGDPKITTVETGLPATVPGAKLA